MLKKLKLALATKLHIILQKHIAGKKPDFTVGKDYLRRWWIIPRNPIFNIYYHNFRVSDDDRALHDHMYFNLSFLLVGGYIEHTPNGIFNRQTGDLKIRMPWTQHRLELLKDVSGNPRQTWTIFITGPRIRKWGFQVGPIVKNWLGFKTKSGWMVHSEYTKKFGEQLNH